MKCLIVEDDPVSRLMLQRVLSRFGESRDVSDGSQALAAFQSALADEAPYDLICLDIMMPGIDGHEVLREIRKLEDERGIDIGDGARIIMTTALDDKGNVLGAFGASCDAYLIKPIDTTKLVQHLKTFGLLAEATADQAGRH
jgi:two-component system chemotaxis response regulator CheY